MGDPMMWKFTTPQHLILLPEGWPVPFSSCRPGLFVHHGVLALATSYGEAYLATGDAWWGGAVGVEARGALIVQPVYAGWTEIKG